MSQNIKKTSQKRDPDLVELLDLIQTSKYITRKTVRSSEEINFTTLGVAENSLEDHTLFRRGTSTLPDNEKSVMFM